MPDSSLGSLARDKWEETECAFFISIGRHVVHYLRASQGWAQQPTAIPVGTVAAELRPITKATEFVGRVEAMERVDIRARVTGFLQEILFKDGDFVKEGDVLYRIERESFRCGRATGAWRSVGSAGEIRQRHCAASTYRGTDEDRRRFAALLDERLAAEKAAQGQVVIADANLKTATVNLGYTDIVAPISGQIGRSKLTKGNVVGPDSGVTDHDCQP